MTAIATSHVVLREISSLILTGRDSLDLLHRISTNDLLTLPPDHPRGTVFTTEIGRIIEVATIIRRGGEGGQLELYTSKGAAGKLKAWIERYIFSEDVRIDSVTDPLPVISVFRPGASAPVGTGGGWLDPFWRGMLLNRPSPDPRPDHRPDPRPDPQPDPRVELTDVATSLGATILSTDQFEFIRVSEGIPAEGRELTPDQNPLEARLADHVSFTKGCYIGQEVIARLDTYKKLKQMLTRFRMTGPTAGQPISGPVYSAASGKPVGRVTSTASATGDAAARGGSQVALGYLDVGVEEIMLKLRPETGSESTIEVVPWEQA